MGKMKRKTRSKWSTPGPGGWACPCCHPMPRDHKLLERRQLRRQARQTVQGGLDESLGHDDAAFYAGGPQEGAGGQHKIEAPPIDTPSADLKLKSSEGHDPEGE